MDQKIIVDFNTVNEIKSLNNILNRKLYDVLSAASGEEMDCFALWVLCFIYYNQETSNEVFQKDIEMYFDIRRPTASKILNGLEEKGFLQRYKDQVDNRRKSLVLTPKAVQFIDQRKEFLAEFNRLFTFGVSKRDYTIFMQVLGDFRSNLDRIRSTRKPPLR